MSAEADVLAAADHLVDAFASGELDTYFGCFAADATFLFHTHDEVLASTDDYRRLWDRWIDQDDFRVLDASSRDRIVRFAGADVAVFVHHVTTRVSTTEGEQTLHERETVVFHRRDGRWLAVHEHLSPDPTAEHSDGP